MIFHILLNFFTDRDGCGSQLAINHRENHIFFRTSERHSDGNTTWNEWTKLAEDRKVEKLGSMLLTHKHTEYAASNHTHTPASIGAAPADHTHTPASIGAAPASHIHWDSGINVDNGIYSGTLRDVLLQNTIHKYSYADATILNDMNYPYSYETVTSDGTIGLPNGWWHIKYFRHRDNNGYGAQLAIKLDGGNMIYFRSSTGFNWNSWQQLYHNGNLNPDTIGRVINGSITIPEMENPEGVYSIIINSGINAKLLFLNSNGAENFLPFFAINGINKLYLPIKYGQGYTQNINFEWYETSVKLTGNDLRGPLIDAHLGYAKYGAYELKWSVIY